MAHILQVNAFGHLRNHLTGCTAYTRSFFASLFSHTDIISIVIIINDLKATSALTSEYLLFMMVLSSAGEFF